MRSTSHRWSHTLVLTHLGDQHPPSRAQHLLGCGEPVLLGRPRQFCWADVWHLVHVEAGMPAGQLLLRHHHGRAEGGQECLERGESCVMAPANQVRESQPLPHAPSTVWQHIAAALEEIQSQERFQLSSSPPTPACQEHPTGTSNVLQPGCQPAPSTCFSRW